MFEVEMLPTRMYTADDLISFYCDLKANTSEAVFTVLKQKQVNQLITKTYTAFSRDGETCNKFVEYVVRPNHILNNEIILLKYDNEPIEATISEAILDYKELFTEEHSKDLFELNLILKDYRVGYKERLELINNYNNKYSPEIDADIHNFLDIALKIILPDNCLAYLELNEDRLNVYQEVYDPEIFN